MSFVEIMTELTTKAPPPILQQDSTLPGTLQHDNHKPAEPIPGPEVRMSAVPWQISISAESEQSNRVVSCNAPSCDLVPITSMQKVVATKPSMFEGESKIFTLPEKQRAVGKRKPLPLKQPTQITPRLTPLRQISSLSDSQWIEKEDMESSEAFGDQDTSIDFYGSPKQLERQMKSAHRTWSLYHSVPHASAVSTPSSPKFSKFQMRTAIPSFSVSRARLRSPSTASDTSDLKPHLKTGQISEPRMASTTADPSSRSRFQSWPGSYRPGRASPCPPKIIGGAEQADPDPDNYSRRESEHTCVGANKRATKEEKSCWSDSEDDEKNISPHLSWRSRRRPKNLRRRLSDWICGPLD